jgi:putative chitinase
MSTNEVLVKMGASSANADKFHEALDAAMEEFNINTPQRKAMFLAQVMHESGKLSAVTENLNYKAASLDAVFPKYFKNAGRDATEYEHQPEKIANIVYASRMGNGDTESGDGYRFRGRGLIQLTGKDNYRACSEGLGQDLVDDPSYLETPEGACRSAAWFWDKNSLNDSADAGDILTNTKKINGGTIGLDDRKAHYEQALDLLS